jgi:hypothetical protein
LAAPTMWKILIVIPLKSLFLYLLEYFCTFYFSSNPHSNIAYYVINNIPKTFHPHGKRIL